VYELPVPVPQTFGDTGGKVYLGQTMLFSHVAPAKMAILWMAFFF
jgi:hypothetical protein